MVTDSLYKDACEEDAKASSANLEDSWSEVTPLLTCLGPHLKQT